MFMSRSSSVANMARLSVLALGLVGVLAGAAWAQTTPMVETTPMNPSGGDPADDVAVWLHPTDRTKSIIFGTNKNHDGAGGLYAFNVDGSRANTAGSWDASNWFSQGDWVNEVDIAYNYHPTPTKTWDIIASANRLGDRVDFYRVDTDTNGDFSALTFVGNINTGALGGDQPYGTAMFYSRDSDKYYVVVSSKNGMVAQYELLYATGGGWIYATDPVWSAQIGGGDRPEIEGITADHEREVVYISAETDAIYRYQTVNGIIQNAGRVTVDTTAGNIRTDIEGLAIYYASDGTGYLIASDQSRDQFIVYDRGWSGTDPNDYIMTFKVGPNVSAGIDVTTQSDGIDVVNVNLGGDFTQGMFIVHDAQGNTPSNYKFVPWEDVAVADETVPNLTIDTSWDPRSVPEPATMGLLALGGLALLRRKRG